MMYFWKPPLSYRANSNAFKVNKYLFIQVPVLSNIFAFQFYLQLSNECHCSENLPIKLNFTYTAPWQCSYPGYKMTLDWLKAPKHWPQTSKICWLHYSSALLIKDVSFIDLWLWFVDVLDKRMYQYRPQWMVLLSLLNCLNFSAIRT